MGQQALANAVEVSTADTLIMSWDDGTPQSETIYPSQTLFPNILALVADISDQMSGWAYLTTGYKVSTNNGSGSGGGTAVTGTLASKLGFTGSETPAGDYITATYSPEGLWLPTTHSSDKNWWRKPAEKLFSGARGSNGALSGISYDVRHSVTKNWPAQPAYNAIENASPGDASSDAERLANAARCFDAVVNDARRFVNQMTGSGNVNARGLYFIDELDDYTGENATFDGNNLPDTWDSGHVEFDTTGAVTNYIWCTPDAPQVPGASFDTTRRYYDVSLGLTTAVAPEWGWDIS